MTDRSEAGAIAELERRTLARMAASQSGVPTFFDAVVLRAARARGRADTGDSGASAAAGVLGRYHQFVAHERFVAYDRRVEETRRWRRFPWELHPVQFSATQGVAQCLSWRGRSMFKTVFDVALYPMLLWDVQPATVIELGSGTGASAVWLADVLRAHRTTAHVYSVDIRRPPVSDPDVTFIVGDGWHIEAVLPAPLLAALPHPWVVLEDMHVNVRGVLRHLAAHFTPGDYLIVEDSDEKQDALVAFAAEQGPACRVDTHYTDFFGRNATCSVDSIFVRMSPQPEARALTTVRRRVATEAKPVAESQPFGDLPVVFEAASSRASLVSWSRDHCAQVTERLARQGAVLFRGFTTVEPADLEALALMFSGGVMADTGEHPPLAGGSRIYTPVAYPADRKLLWHNENSFNREWPTQIWFACLTPAASGGETPLVDSRRVFSALDPEVRDSFQRKQVMYIRNYGTGFGRQWHEVFGTTDRTQVEAACQRSGMAFRWKSDDTLETTAVRPAVLTVDGSASWFNQAQHWHGACLDEATRQALEAIYAAADFPRICRFGDGTTIPDEMMHHILAVYQQLEVTFEWRRGDVLVLENRTVAHGRNPYTGERKHLVALGAVGRFDGPAVSSHE